MIEQYADRAHALSFLLASRSPRARIIVYFEVLDFLFSSRGEYVESAEAAALRHLAWVAILHRLTPTQLRLCDLRLEGKPLTECAVELGLTYEAARWQRQLIMEVIQELL